MIQITLSEQEAEMLRDTLMNYKSDLRMEIAATEQMDFRERLKEREAFLKDLIQRLEDQPSRAS